MSSVHLLKTQLKNKSLSEQIYAYEKDQRSKQQVKDKIKKENAVTDQDEKLKIVHSRRRQADLHNMRLSFLR